MIHSQRRKPSLSLRTGVLSFVGVISLLAGGLASTATAQAQTVSPFNPFSVNQGFSAVTTGNIVLNNGEVEGSIAAFGSVSTTKDKYPVVHAVAGVADYQVPTIDGVPVRILANDFEGTGAIEQTNSDNSGTILPESPEAKAVVKFADISGLTASERGNFVRLTNKQNGILDLTKVLFGDASLSDFKTDRPQVSDYFGDFTDQIQHTSTCLTAMYEPAAGLVNHVDPGARDGMLFPQGFATDKPNVMNYSDLVGKTIKMENAQGYRPTAQAPLVIRVDAGTTTIGKIGIEGWSSSASQDQNLARYILLDLSEVTGKITIDQLELGAVWAPNAEIDYNSDVTTNGQWFSGRNIQLAGAGEFHHHLFGGLLPCVQSTVAPEPAPVVPVTLATTVAVAGVEGKVLPLSGGTLVDTVVFEGLTPGVEYELVGEVRVAADGTKTGIAASAVFVPDSAAGSTVVEFVVTAALAEEFAGQKLVVFETLLLDGEFVAEHADLEDEAQSFVVAEVPVDENDMNSSGGNSNPEDEEANLRPGNPNQTGPSGTPNEGPNSSNGSGSGNTPNQDSGTGMSSTGASSAHTITDNNKAHQNGGLAATGAGPALAVGAIGVLLLGAGVVVAMSRRNAAASE